MIARLLDSVILIDHFNDVDKATRFLAGLDPNQTAISVITRAEILVGIDREKERDRAKSLLDQFTLFIIDQDIADEAASLRREFGWKLPDAFQAAIALHHRIRLVTRNTEDFDPAQHDFVEVPYLLSD